jgi:branched-chain amino acid transport system substrate-binding protein
MAEDRPREITLSRRLTVGALLALAWTAGTLPACKGKSNDIPIGAFLSLSGADSTFGTDTRDGIELATEEVNAAGGVHGKKIRVIYEDNKSLPQEASNKVRQLIDRDKVVAILGEVASSRSMAGGLIANSKKVPMVTPSSTAVDVTKDREYVFRTCFTDDQQGEVAGRFVKEKLGRESVAIFFAAQDTYSSGLAQSFKRGFEKVGGKVVLEKGYQKGETNFTTYLTELKGSNPDAIFAPVYYNDMVQIARQAKQVGIPGSMFVGGDGWDSANLLEGAAGELEGAHFTNHYAPDVPWENSQKFIQAFQAKYKRAPNSLSAQGYDAARLLYDAIARAPEVTPEAIKNALADTKEFAGATGNITIDKNHNANKPIVVVKIEDKAFKYAGMLEAK